MSLNPEVEAVLREYEETVNKKIDEVFEKLDKKIDETLKQIKK